MYVIDFFKNLFKKSNIGLIIWLVLNTLLIVALFSGFFTDWQGALLGFGIYLLSLVIALSPIGEWILRLQSKCKKITDPAVLARLQPLFDEVYAKAKELNPELPNDIKMFMSDDMDPNAFATGRKTLCVTRGLLSYSDEHIKGVMGHEFGHLAHKDTDQILIIAVGNMIVSAIFVIVRVIANISMIIGEFLTAVFSESWGGIFASIFIGIARVVSDFILVLMMRAWTQIGVWLVMHTSRQNEYRADAYSHQCGYGYALSEVLESFGTGHGKDGLFAALESSHPDNGERVRRLREMAPAAVSAPTTPAVMPQNNNTLEKELTKLL